jgi:hypothetical protein
MFSNLNHSIFQTEKGECEYDGEVGNVGNGTGGTGGTGGSGRSGRSGRRGGEGEGGGNKYKNTSLKKEKYIDKLYDDEFIKNYF